MWACIGSRTTRERNARGEGITLCRVGADGTLAPVQVVGGLVNPSFLASNRRGDRLYTVHGDGEACSLLEFDAADGRLAWRQTQSFAGRNPVHLALAPDERHLVVSSHLTGEVVVMPVDTAGWLGPVCQRVPLPGQPGPHRVEQPHAKPHHNPFDPGGRFVVVPDKGLDRLFVFAWQSGRLVPANMPSVPAREGAGPRHVAFHPGRRWMYAVNELDSTVTAWRFDPVSGALAPFQWLPLRPDTYTGDSRASEIGLGADGQTLYASNRGADSIEVFRVDAATGRLRHLQSRDCEGRTPRFFALQPDGAALHVLNEDSDTIVTMAVDPADGTLGPTRSTLRCGSPVCMVFLGEG